MANPNDESLCRNPYYRQQLGELCHQKTGSLFSSDYGNQAGAQDLGGVATSFALMAVYIGLLVGLVWLMRKKA